MAKIWLLLDVLCTWHWRSIDLLELRPSTFTLISTTVLEELLALAFLVEDLELTVLEALAALATISVTIEGVDSSFLGWRVALCGDEVAWSRELCRILMKIWPSVEHHLSSVLATLHIGAWAFLKLVQGGEDLRVWLLATVWEHDGLTSGVLGRRNSGRILRDLVLEDTSYHCLALIYLEGGNLPLIGTTW